MSTLVPRNMASPLKSALKKLEKRRGDIDQYVAKELGYSPSELKKYFAGEQVDAIGLAIDNISQGAGFIIGDQTGIGKGRVNAAIIRYARQKGLTPVFITMKPDLYADMIRDLNDIGETGFNPLPTNAGLTGERSIPLPDGRMLRTKDSKKHTNLLQKAAYNEAMKIIDGSVFDELPISPIDFITAELERRGISVGEITGRTHAVEYLDGVAHYRSRKTSSAQNIETMRKFNSGELDTMILNQAGSTGISLHSSSTFADQRRRTMIIVQPELNIDVFMQTLGRVFRTGQVVPPSYKLLTSDIPAEKRPSAVLGKKMAGLNANTTASRTTDTTFQNIPDFLNEYGDLVTAQIMAEEPELHAALGSPLKSKDKGLDKEDAVRKVTGRIPMLPLKEQQALYERIETDYRELIAQLEATGGSALEAKTLPLDARMVESSELTPAREDVGSDSPFAAESRLGLFDVKVLGKPYTPEQVEGMVTKGRESGPDMESVRKNTLEWLNSKLETIENEETRENLDDKPLASLRDKPTPGSKPVRVVDVDPSSIPVDTADTKKLVAWLRDYYGGRNVTINDTGENATFTNRGLRESAKRRGEVQRKGYAALDRLLEQSVFDRFEEADARHAAWLSGQNIYVGAMRLGDSLYAVKLKLDVPLHREWLQYKDHKVTEIEIAPILSAAKLSDSDKSQPGASDIREVSLGVLRGAVKPSQLNDGMLSSLSPGEFLPPRRKIRQRLRGTVVRSVAKALSKRARNAVPTRVVDSFDELPARLQRAFADQSDRVEGVYYDGTVWLVAENLTDAGRVADVWMHEQVVHGGLRSLFGKDGVDRLLRRLWISEGGMGNTGIAEIARRYGLKPRTDPADCVMVMEEYLASLIEKGRESFTPKDLSAWRRFLRAITEMWNTVVEAVTGRPSLMGMTEIEALLYALESHVMNGTRPIDVARKLYGSEALASVNGTVRDTTDAPRASLRNISGDDVASGIRLLRKVLGRNVSEDVEDILKNPEMGKLVGKSDMSLWERLFKLPYWVAKDHPGFARVHDRQTRRVEERSAALKKSLEQVSLLYDPDPKNRLNKQEMAELNSMIWKWDGKEIPELKGVEKFIVKDKTLNGRDVLEHNPEFYPVYEKWLAKQPQSARARQAFLQVRKSLDDDFLKAYTKMASMSDLADTDLEMYRTSFGNIPNYFPHQRKGKYYVTATVGKGVVGDPRITVFRKHFDVPLGSSVREEWAKIVAEHRKAFPNATWHNPREADKLPDEILGAPIDANAMEQIIKAATARLGNGELAAEVESVLLSGVSDVLKARGFGAHGIERQNIPGHDTENLIDVLYSYKAGLNGWLTKMEAAMTEGFRKGSTPKDIFQESLGDLIGIPYDMLINRPSKGLVAASNESYDKVAEAVLPVFMANMMQAWRLYSEGQTTQSGRPINDPGKQGARKLSASESFGKVLGFQPVSSTKSYDAYNAQTRRDAVRSEKIGDLATAMLTARERNDVPGMVAARKELKAWNEKMEREGKPLMRIKLADVQRRMVARRREAKATPKNAAKGRAFAEVWGG